MAAPSASGNFRLIIEAGRTLLADSAAFRTLVGAANQAEALAYINRDAIDANEDGSEIDLPFARVWVEESDSEEIALGTWNETGVLHIGIEARAPGSYAAASDGEAWAANTLGDIIDEMKTLVSSGGYLTARRFSREHPGRPQSDQAGGANDYWIMDVRISYGVEPT